MDQIIDEVLNNTKTCPFCGSDRIVISYITPHDNFKLWKVTCHGCGCGTGYCPTTKEETLKIWNRRVIDPADYERLKRCNHECKIDSLLKEYDRVKEERDKALNDRQFLVDSIRNLLNKMAGVMKEK